MGLDAVELILAWEETFAIQIAAQDAEQLHTPAQAIAYIAQTLNVSRSTTGVCPTLRAFNRVRQSIRRIVDIPRNQVQLSTQLRELFPKTERRQRWQQLETEMGTPRFPRLEQGWLSCAGSFADVPILNVQHLVDWLVTYYPIAFIAPGQLWTYSQIRSIVRATIRHQMQVRDFADDVDLQQEFA
ncbi:MAG: hypothetical protein AAGG51_21760 [Cyanobacteria bacterium P01_G01_bin.54]